MAAFLDIFKGGKKEKERDKGGAKKSSGSGRGEGKLKKVLQEPMPPEKELNEMFEQLITALGVGPEQRALMAQMDAANKWTLILQEREKKASGATAPTRLAKELEGGKISLKDLEGIRISLANEPVKWANEFVAAGGVAHMFKHLSALIGKAGKTPTDLDYLTEYTRCLKNLMNVKSGLDAVVATKGAIAQLVNTLDFVSDRTQASILEALAGLSCPDIVADGHGIILAALQFPAASGATRLEQVVTFLRGDAFSTELKVSAMTLVNALINYTPSLAARKDFRDSLAVYDVVEALKRKVRAPGLVKEHTMLALETQLYVFEESLDDDNGGGGGEGRRAGAPKENAAELFNQLLSAVRNTPAADVLPSLLQHLSLLKRDGRLGKQTWEVVDKFVAVTANMPPSADAAELATAAGRAAGAALKGNDKLMLEAMRRPEPAAIAGDASLSAEEKIAALVKLCGTQAVELEDLRARGGGGGGGAPPPPPPPGLKGPPPPPGLKLKAKAAASGAAGEEGAGEGGEEGGPPPPPGGGPPPPPPPGMKGKGPPPPPGAKGAGGLPKKPVIKPRVPMKQLHWAKLADRLVPKSVWASVNDENVRVNADQLEALFAANAPAAKAPEEDKSKSAVIQVLDTKRHNNISIMLSRFKEVELPALRQHLLELSDSDPLLMGDNLMALKQYVPTAEERVLLEAYVASPKREQLGLPERYFLEVMSIPRLDSRLECFYVRQSFAAKAAALADAIDAVQSAVNEVRRSKRFVRALEILLAIGNYLNGSTFRGGAYGFKLEALLKLGEIKTVSNKETLLHYLAELSETTMPELRELSADFAHLEAATKEPIQQLVSDANQLKKGLGLVEKELAQFPPDSPDRLRVLLAAFFEPARAQMDDASAALAALDKSYRELAAYYGEDDTTDSLTFFTYVWRFVSGLDKARDDNARRKALAVKQAEIAAAAAVRKREQEAKRAAKLAAAKNEASEESSEGGVETRREKEDRNILDNQLSRMRAGVIARANREAQVADEAKELFSRLKSPRPGPTAAEHTN